MCGNCSLKIYSDLDLRLSTGHRIIAACYPRKPRRTRASVSLNQSSEVTQKSQKPEPEGLRELVAETRNWFLGSGPRPDRAAFRFALIAFTTRVTKDATSTARLEVLRSRRLQ